MVIHRPLEEVFVFLADVENWTRWQSAFLRSEQTSCGLMDVGTKFRQALDAQGKRVELLCEVTGYELNEKISFACICKHVAFTVNFIFEPVDGGTKLTGKGEGQLGGFYSLLEPLVGGEIDNQLKANLDNLKRLLESQAPGDP